MTSPFDDQNADALLEFPSLPDTRALLSLAGAVLAQGGRHDVTARQERYIERYAAAAGFSFRTEVARGGFGAFVDDVLMGWHQDMSCEELMLQFRPWVHEQSADDAASWADYGFAGSDRDGWLYERMTGLKLALDADFSSDGAHHLT